MKQATTIAAESPDPGQIALKTVYPILFTISFSHCLNDMMQSVIPAVYPLFKDKFALSFTQIGLITLAFQLSASLLQPFVGMWTDKRPSPHSLAIGMGFTLTGLIFLALAFNFISIVLSVCLIGIGSSIFHPESSRVAYLASGGKRGLAQSIFQVGGNTGSAIGPLLAAILIVPHGQLYIIWFGLAALLAIGLLLKVGQWYKEQLVWRTANKTSLAPETKPQLSKGRIITSVIILLVLIFSKYFYTAGLTSYFTFYLIDKFHVSIQQSQIYLFIFLAAVAVGTVLGGPLGDRFGRKYVIWFSILGAAPFTLLLPYAGLFWTVALSAVIGIIISSAFPAILVYATELLPGKVGLVSGLFYGFAFGMGGLGSAVLGNLADHTSIQHVFAICAYLPLIGIITAFLPRIGRQRYIGRPRVR